VNTTVPPTSHAVNRSSLASVRRTVTSPIATPPDGATPGTARRHASGRAIGHRERVDRRRRVAVSRDDGAQDPAAIGARNGREIGQSATDHIRVGGRHRRGRTRPTLNDQAHVPLALTRGIGDRCLAVGPVAPERRPTGGDGMESVDDHSLGWRPAADLGRLTERYGAPPGVLTGTVDAVAADLVALGAAGAEWCVVAPLDYLAEPRRSMETVCLVAEAVRLA